ncbi:hypothetical protein MRX96_027098 [Rhipicephalus microplus]
MTRQNASTYKLSPIRCRHHHRVNNRQGDKTSGDPAFLNQLAPVASCSKQQAMYLRTAAKKIKREEEQKETVSKFVPRVAAVRLRNAGAVTHARGRETPRETK